MMKQFDLNIDRILENWECRHAVREIIANALDEQRITGTQNIRIYKDGDEWVIRDFGRGLKYEHLVQKENSEKLNSIGLIGKFGIGLKDALATFDRNGVRVKIFSKFGDVSINRLKKHGFDDLTTLHAIISPPTYDDIKGTEFRLSNIDDKEIYEAKRLFLRFTSHDIIEATKFGEVVESDGSGKIFINGVLVAQEQNFLFSYNITVVDSILKKFLNRERSNVGRSAYAPAVRRILLNCQSSEVGDALSEDLKSFSSGLNHDELKWIDVQSHAAKICAQNSNVVYVTTDEIKNNIDLVNEASTNREIVVIPNILRQKIEENNAFSPDDEKITTFTKFVQDRSENFEYKFVDISTCSKTEKENYDLIYKIFDLIGGKPSHIKSVLISETMQSDTTDFYACEGIWKSSEGSIIILRSRLNDKKRFLGIFLHELAHAISGYTDETRGFERTLTDLLGLLASELL